MIIFTCMPYHSREKIKSGSVPLMMGKNGQPVFLDGF